MALILRADGTITFTMPGKEGKPDVEMTLRSPTLDEMLDMWSEVENLQTPSETPKISDTMRSNLRWMRSVIARLGDPALYVPAEKAKAKDPDDWTLTNGDVTEPAWFINGNLAAQWLRHWQEPETA